MSTKKTVLIAVLVFIVLIFFSLFVSRGVNKMLGIKGSSATVLAGKDNWLVINPSGTVPEYNEIQAMPMFQKLSANSVESISAKIRYAITDVRIKGILLEPSGGGFSLPAIHEIGLALNEFKAAGKPVYAAGDMISQADYLLASYADEIAMDPSASGGIMLTGVAANSLFFKGFMDKYGIKMHVIQAGEFKGAGEPFSQTGFSEGTRQNISKVFSGLFEEMLSLLAANRGLTVEDMRAVYNDRRDLFILADEALELKLIDTASTRADYLAKHKITKNHTVSIAKYKNPVKLAKGDKIAVVYLSGDITPGTASYGRSQISYNKVRKITQEISKNKHVKAVVLRVDSPGGSALESDHIYRDLLKLKEDKPLVVSMSGVAASGGYYISCAADKIVADSGTIAGSIGVIMMLPEYTQASRRLGITSETIKFGKFASAINPFEPYSPELLASIKRSAAATYDEFKGIVMDARGIAPEKINSIAEGRVYSAEDALALGLIDEIASLDKAVALAAELADISSYSTINYPQKISFFDALSESDFFGMMSLKLFGSKLNKYLDEYESALEMMEPGIWQYRMPLQVDKL
ncbi:MAG: signal peptide peptidase SppA [Candidatus Cloacimonetes bacterium]|nr:signal peptide peptidase SppA [Candidatus Cloacimonadota bacterium]